MGHLPIAQPTPRRTWHFSRRVIPLALLVLGAVAVFGVALAVAWPTPENVRQITHGPNWVAVAWVDALAVNEPVRIVEHRIYLVKLESGETLALYQKDPRPNFGCTVPFNPRFEFAGHTGWFRNPCHGQTYDLTGTCFDGPCARGLDRYEVRVQDGHVQIDVNTLILGPPVAPPGQRPVTPE